jgi:hypothetical protein
MRTIEITNPYEPEFEERSEHINLLVQAMNIADVLDAYRVTAADAASRKKGPMLRARATRAAGWESCSDATWTEVIGMLAHRGAVRHKVNVWGERL